MKKTQIFSVFGLLWLLCISALARGQTPITIYGDANACKGDTTTYFVSPTAGIDYFWSTSIHGNVSGAASPSVIVSWLAPGSASVNVYGVDSTGDTVQVGVKAVTVHALPVPSISTNARVGCQQLAGDTLRQGHEGNNHLPPVILDDGNGCIKVCEYSTVTYYGHDMPGTTYTWDVSGEVSFVDMGDSCIVHWAGTGPGSVTVYATNINGCKASKTICISIIEKPSAIFYTMPDSTYNTNATSNSITICLGDNVIFNPVYSTGSPGSPLMTTYWDFGDGTPTINNSGTPAVSHTFNTSSTYQVMLVVTNACNCKDTAYVTVNVKPDAGVYITCPGVVCEGDTAGYKVHQTGCASYLWDARGGTILNTMPYTDSINIVWDNVDTTGFGYVIFDAATCPIACPGKTILKIPVIQQNGHISGPQIVCPGKQYIYRLPQWPTTDFNWSVSGGTGAWLLNTDQRNEIVINTVNPGTITLNVSYTNTMLHCGGTASINIQVQPPVTISGPTKVCHKGNATWTLSGGTLGNWTLTLPDNSTQTLANSNSFSTTFNLTGNYTLSVSGAFCGPDPLNLKVNPLPPPPDSLLGPTIACAGVPTQYTAKNPLPGTIFSWKAYTGNVNGATGDNTYATFTGSGPWVIAVRRQETTGAYCKSDSIKLNIAPPVPALVISGPDTVCASTYHNYSVNYTGGDTYEWSIVAPGRGSVDSGQSTTGIKVLWNNVTGSGQQAWLIVKVRKCFGYYYDSLSVFIVPTVTLNVTVDSTDICSGETVNFTVTSSPSISYSGGITWNFGDGPPVPGGMSQPHTYDITGINDAIFNAIITIDAPNGCADAVGYAPAVLVRPAPVAHVSPEGPIVMCTPTWPIHLVATANTGLGTTALYTWSPSGPSGMYDSTWDVSAFGSYYCTVQSSNGCSAQSNVVSIIQDCTPPCGPGNEPTFAINGSVTACGHVQVNATSSWGFASGWIWPGSTLNPTPSGGTFDGDFDVAGNYQFTYYVKYVNTAGDTCLADTSISIVVPFIADMFSSFVCVNGLGYDVTMMDNSNYYPGVTLTHQYFVDWTPVPALPTATTVTTLVGPGAHVLAEVISWGGYPPCTVIHNIVLDTLPIANFTVSNPMPACEDWVAVQFTNTSIPSTGLTSLWSFGDGTTNSQTHASKVYENAGNYWVQLTVTNAHGCYDRKRVQVRIVTDKLDGTVVSLPNYPCEGDPVTLTYTPNLGTVYPTLYTWYQHEDVLYANVPNSSITTYVPGGYWVHGTDNFGCIVNTPLDTVNITQVPPAVITGDSSQCVGVPFSLGGFAGDDIQNYVWIRDGVAGPMGNYPTLDNEVFATPGTHIYRLVVLVPNPGGGYCTDTSLPFPVVINPLPAPPIASFSMVDCDDYSVKLSASASGPGSFTWSNGMSGTPILVNAGGPYKVWFTDLNGCRNGTNLNVPKDPKTFMWVFPSGCYQFCKDDLPFYILGPNNVSQWYPWTWLQNDLSVYSGFGPVLPYNVTAAGQYNLVLNNGYCVDTSDDMHLSVVDCKGGPCDKITMDIKEVLNPDGTPALAVAGSDADAAKAAAAAPAPAPTDPCTKLFVITFNNLYAPGGYNIWTSSGTLTPPGGSLPLGTTTTTYTFTPAPGFTGGWIYVYASVYFQDGTKCDYVDSVYVKCKGGPGSLAVTEMSNGPEGKECEYAEMVVVNCRNSADKFVDVRGWVMDDNSGNFNVTGCVNGVGITDGHYRLTYESIWSSVPVGSIIVIYNHDQNCYKLPNNFQIDNMGSYNVYWIPIGGTPSAPYGTPHVERYDKLPTVGNCRYCSPNGNNYQVANSWTKTIGFDDKNDAFQVRCPGCTSLNPMEPAFYHGFGYGPAPVWATIPATANNLGGPVQNTNGFNAKFVFNGSTKPHLGNPAAWAKLPADPVGTPPPTLGNINAGLMASIQQNTLDLPCCDIKQAEKNGGEDADSQSGNKGMKGMETAQGVRVYPNPATDKLNVEFPMCETATVRIVDIHGRVVTTQTVSNGSLITIDVRGYIPGLYMYHVATDNVVQTGKVLIGNK